MPELGIDGDTRQYTLVLDLDETLVHYKKTSKSYLVRPGCNVFLEDLSKHYQIVVFTASIQKIADRILNKLDPENKLIKHRLYRQHTTMTARCAIKDLSRLGRPL